MADVRTFRAASMQEALDLVREEMGSDAVILHTRHVEGWRSLPFRQPREGGEITACLRVNGRSLQQRSSGRQRTETTHTAELAPNAFRQHNANLPRPQRQPNSGDPLGLITVANTRPASSNAMPSYKSSVAQKPTTAQPERNGQSSGPNGWQRSTATTPRTSQPAASPATNGPLVVSGRVSPEVSVQEFARKLDSIQEMIHKLGQTRTAKADEIPQELFQLYTDLLDAELDDEEARDLISRVKQEADPATLANAAATRALLAAIVESHVRAAPPISVRNGKRHVVALVGPTGVGKTTTIAKLAANFRLREGVRMGLVTVDTYRIAAVEQLRTYAEIIDLPMKVVTSPLEMRRALDELSGLDLVLIDTAGRSPRDELKIQELKSLLAEAQVDEVQLVMSLTASLKSLQATAQKFAAAGTTSMILTKLDEAAGAGALFSAARRVPLPISYLTTGQDVPEDIEPANARRITRLILGEDKLFH